LPTRKPTSSARQKARPDPELLFESPRSATALVKGALQLHVASEGFDFRQFEGVAIAVERVDPFRAENAAPKNVVEDKFSNLNAEVSSVVCDSGAAWCAKRELEVGVFHDDEIAPTPRYKFEHSPRLASGRQNLPQFSRTRPALIQAVLFGDAQRKVVNV
jgi:hypothetical protein